MKNFYKNWKKFLNVSEVLDPNAGGDFYENYLSSIEQGTSKTPITGKIKTSCNCVDRSESSLSVPRIKNILNKYYSSNPDPSIGLLPETGPEANKCDLETKNAIIRFQADTNIEQDGCVGNETEGKMIELGLLNKIAATINIPPKKNALDKVDSAIGDIEYVNLPQSIGSSLSHVEEAKKEMILFKDGNLKEWDPKVWPYIAKYWSHIGSEWFAKKTLKGYYLKNKPDRTYHWSAAFIQYCMRGNQEFQELQAPPAKKGNHSYYWRAAERNTKKLKSGQLPKGKWFYLWMHEASSIGYKPQVGDILFIGNRRAPKYQHHGDIVVATSGGPATCDGYQKIGGNNDNSVMLQHRKNTAVLTQNPDAYDKFLKAYNLNKPNNNQKTPTINMLGIDSIIKKYPNKFSFYLGTVNGSRIDSHNENSEFYGASIQKPVAALAQLIQYKQDKNKRLNDEELRMLLSYSKTFRGSNQVNRAISRNFRGGSKSYKKRNLGKISPEIMKQILSVFDITNNTKFVYSNNKQSSLDYYKFLSGLQRMSSGKYKNQKEKQFALSHKEEINKILKYTDYIPDYISDSLRKMGVSKFWGKGGRAIGSLNYGFIIDNKYVLVVYTRFSRVKFGQPGYEKTGRNGEHTKMMLSIVNHLVKKIK